MFSFSFSSLRWTASKIQHLDATLERGAYTTREAPPREAPCPSPSGARTQSLGVFQTSSTTRFRTWIRINNPTFNWPIFLTRVCVCLYYFLYYYFLKISKCNSSQSPSFLSTIFPIKNTSALNQPKCSQRDQECERQLLYMETAKWNCKLPLCIVIGL